MRVAGWSVQRWAGWMTLERCGLSVSCNVQHMSVPEALVIHMGWTVQGSCDCQLRFLGAPRLAGASSAGAA